MPTKSSTPAGLLNIHQKLWSAATLPRLKAFYQQEQDVILKPLDGMGGASIFRLKPDDANVSVIIETLTEHGQPLCHGTAFYSGN